MKAIIYLRTSTEDQEPENQKKECLEFAKNRGYEVTEVLLEKLSGYKQIDRPEYDKAKEMARKGEIKAVIVWALDRWVRNRDTLLEDVTILKNYGCKIHSVRDSWIEAINIEGPLGRTINDFLLGLISSLAEMESEHKSNRVKLATRKRNNITYSYRGKKWGRKPISKQAINKVIELRKEGLSLREISKQVTYAGKNNQVKNVSLALVHKILKENQANLSVEKLENNPVQDLNE